MLAGGDTNSVWLQSLAHCGVPEDIIWRGRLLDEPDIRRSASASNHTGATLHLVRSERLTKA